MSGQTVEAPRVGGPGSGTGGSWKVIVRNDNHNTFDHVAQTLARIIPGVTLERGHEIANVIHSTGQAIVYSGQQEPAEFYWEQLNGAGLAMAPLERGGFRRLGLIPLKNARGLARRCPSRCRGRSQEPRSP